jgi:hypothetical protein
MSQEMVTLKKEIIKRDKAIETLNQKYDLVEKRPHAPSINPIPNAADYGSNTEGTVDFGTAFPPNPQPDDMFVRVDQLPNKLYKYNSQTWVEERDANDIKEEVTNLIDSLQAGSVQLKDLTEEQKTQIKAALSRENVLGR